MDDVHVSGLPELQKLLDTLPVKIEKNILRGALRAGMKVIQPFAQSNVRSVSGLLANGLKIGTRATAGTVVGKLSAKGPHGYVAMWVEFGTRPHFISVSEKERPINMRLSTRRGRLVRVSMTTINRAIRSLKIAGNFVGPTVFHPGANPHPFMRPALDAQAQKATIAVAEYIKRRLETKHGLDTAHIMIEGD